jgi:hypothetical protein
MEAATIPNRVAGITIRTTTISKGVGFVMSDAKEGVVHQEVNQLIPLSSNAFGA